MNNKITVFIGVLLFLFVFITSVFAKRLGPPSVDDVIFDGVKYSAPNIEIGYVEAKNINDNSLIWKKKVYDVNYQNNLEKDVQDIYITNLKIEDTNLLVTNERGEVYRINLKTGEGSINNLKNNSSKRLLINLGLITFLVCVTAAFFYKRKNIF